MESDQLCGPAVYAQPWWNLSGRIIDEAARGALDDFVRDDPSKAAVILQRMAQHLAMSIDRQVYGMELVDPLDLHKGRRVDAVKETS